MNEMIERVSSALQKHEADTPFPDYWTIARAAIEAMREPTFEMLCADDKATICGANHLPEYEARGVWHSMIDAALAEDTTEPRVSPGRP